MGTTGSARPRVLGHEIAGEVVSTGAEVTGWAAGDRVEVIAAIPCGACREAGGHATVCTSRENMGYSRRRLCRVHVVRQGHRRGRIEPDPDGTGFAAASLAEPLACVLNAQELCRVSSGDEVLIIGDGPAAACTAGWPAPGARPASSWPGRSRRTWPGRRS